MSKETASTALMAFTPEQLALEAKEAITRLGNFGGGDVIRTRNKAFVLPDGTEIPNEMDAVILDYVFVNEMYEGRFDPKNIAPPICAAKGQNADNMLPYDQAPKKQADACNSCPNNQWGSDGKGKACKNGVWLAVIEANATDASQVYVLKLAPTALAGFKKYAAQTMTALNSPLFGVVTHFEFDKSVDYAKIMLSNPTMARNPNIEQAVKRRGEANMRLLQPTNFEPLA